MNEYRIYVTEPDVIDMALVEHALGDTPHILVAGNTSFTNGEPSACNAVLIRSATHIDNTVLAHMPQLKHVVRAGTGLDNVDQTFCQRNGISVYNAPGANAEAVAEYVLTVTLMALRKLHLLERSDLETWNRFKFGGHSIATQRVGIIGFGHIGRLVYEKLRALGCHNFLLHDPFVHDAPEDATLVPLDGLLEHSTVISMHLPLLPQTRHSLNADNLKFLKEGAILINSSRGGVVDEQAVLEQLQTKTFTYVADTVEGEPQVNPTLLDNPNVFVSPHIASLTDEAEAAMVRISIENLLAGKTAPAPPV